jgi:signal peptidase II
LAAVVIVVDQITKSLAARHLAAGAVHVLGPLDLQLSYNSGAAFGLGNGWGLTPVLVTVGVILVVVLFGVGRNSRSWLAVVASGLMVGGALSNLGDRLFRGNGGAVIDFIRLPHWPNFNVADSSIVVGVGLLVLANLRQAT